MTTLNIGTLYINNPHLRNKPLDEIKAFLTQVLESDLVSNMTIKRKSKWDKIDEQLRSMKVVKQESADELENSLTILGNEVKKAGYTDHKTARDEYLTQKYN